MSPGSTEVFLADGARAAQGERVAMLVEEV
jgi:hypothetical protein